jgi:hypothetical protein
LTVERLPNFFIIGAQKSGTTSLQRYLSDHPQAHCVGETHFFDFHFDRGLDWYRGLFRAFAERPALGEKCPEYLFHPRALARIARAIPDARLIAVLRDPVDRAYSHYWHARRLGQESLSFEDALDAERERVARGQWGLAYTIRGRYLRQIQVVLEHFPRQALLVLIFEDLKASPQETFWQACRFLGIDDRVRPPSLGAVANPYRVHRMPRAARRLRLVGANPRQGRVAATLRRMLTRPATYPPMAPSTRARLAELFAEDNRALAAWLGRDLSAWTSRDGS